MSSDRRYCGWTNYETWAVKLWIDNDEGAYRFWREQTRQVVRDAPSDVRVAEEIWTVAEAARFALADDLKEFFERAAPDLGASMWADLLNAALSEVNWNEIAANMLGDLE